MRRLLKAAPLSRGYLLQGDAKYYLGKSPKIRR